MSSKNATPRVEPGEGFGRVQKIKNSKNGTSSCGATSTNPYVPLPSSALRAHVCFEYLDGWRGAFRVYLPFI